MEAAQVRLYLSCTDKRSNNAPGQHGGSLQTRFIESMRAHVITKYGKCIGRPQQYFNLKLLKGHCPTGTAKFRLPEFHVTSPKATKYTTLFHRAKLSH